ncbi:hypothetical protein JCGZ_19381 [Jatropha curcas]|uniref:Uncharacterized protein n=1 Tax=Jatropha curcas TaxID=180498 RepID=A0A067KBE7_JATCU|nr:hypothetical protein JCGZ_19381 [Jatropha curcas]
MSHLSEIPASAYTREMETFGALPDIPTFDGEPVSVSRNPLTPGTRPCRCSFFRCRVRSFQSAAEAGGAAAPAEPAGVVLGDVPFPPGMEVVLDPGLGLGSGIIIAADLRQAPPPVQLDPEHTTHVEGIPLDSSDEDEDGSSSDGAPPSPPPPTVAGPSRRRQ